MPDSLSSAAWALRLQGIPVIHFVCKSGMSRCVLGTYRDNLEKRPPCKKCIAQSMSEYDNARVIWFDYHPDPVLERDLEKVFHFGAGGIHIRILTIGQISNACPTMGTPKAPPG